jgi:MFS family permease
LRDSRLLYGATFLRASATGLAGVILGIYLARLALEPAAIGIVVSAGLLGSACASVLVTFAGDRLGRRRVLAALALMGGAGGLVLAAASHPPLLALAAFVGMVNGMGRDRGPALILEHAILPATVTAGERTRAFAWYNILQDGGLAAGGLLAAGPAVLGLSELPGLRSAVALSAALVLATALLYGRLSAAVEPTPIPPGPRLTPASRRVVARISTLFALDSLGGGFLGAALVSLFFFTRFGADPAALGVLFFAARLANAGSHLGAAWLARRIGLLNTMVFTHIPSSLLLMTVPFAPSFAVAALLFLAREALVEMDVPTRQSYVMAVVRPEERTVASGVTHLVRTGAWAVAPALAALLMRDDDYTVPLIVGAAMKLVYDGLLFVAFRGVRPPEEET